MQFAEAIACNFLNFARTRRSDSTLNSKFTGRRLSWELGSASQMTLGQTRSSATILPEESNTAGVTKTPLQSAPSSHVPSPVAVALATDSYDCSVELYWVR